MQMISKNPFTLSTIFPSFDLDLLLPTPKSRPRDLARFLALPTGLPNTGPS